MRRLIITLVAIAALAVLCLPTGAAEPHMNGVEVSPGFAISGDNVTISVLGPANRYAALTVTSSDGLSVLETHVILDSLGRGAYAWTVPIDLPSGEYTVRGTFPGNLTDSSPLRVVFDEDVSQTVRIDELEERLDAARMENLRLAAEVERINAARATDTMLVTASVLIAGGCLAYMIVKYRERWEWLAANDRRRGWRQMVARTLLHPNVPDMVEDQIGFVGPNLRKARADRRAAREGTVNMTPAVILPGKDGVDVLTVDVPEIEMKEKSMPGGVLARIRRRVH